MSFSGEREAIGTLFRDGWAGRTPVAVPNGKFDPPQGPWVRLSFMQGDANQLEIGTDNPYHRFIGVVFVQLHDQLEKGDAGMRALGDVAAGIFRRKRVEVPPNGGIVFRTPMLRPNGTDGKYAQMIMSVPYTYDTTF